MVGGRGGPGGAGAAFVPAAPAGARPRRPGEPGGRRGRDPAHSRPRAFRVRWDRSTHAAAGRPRPRSPLVASPHCVPRPAPHPVSADGLRPRPQPAAAPAPRVPAGVPQGHGLPPGWVVKRPCRIMRVPGVAWEKPASPAASRAGRPPPPPPAMGTGVGAECAQARVAPSARWVSCTPRPPICSDRGQPVPRAALPPRSSLGSEDWPCCSFLAPGPMGCRRTGVPHPGGSSAAWGSWAGRGREPDELRCRSPRQAAGACSLWPREERHKAGWLVLRASREQRVG